MRINVIPQFDLLQKFLRYILLLLANLRFFSGDILRSESSRVITFLLVLTTLLSINYKKFNYRYYLILLGCIICNLKFGGPAVPLIIIFLISSVLAEEKIRNLSLISLILQIFFLIYMMLNVGSGSVIEDIVESEKGVTRDLGFGNSNVLGGFLLSVTATILFVFAQKQRIKLILNLTLPIVLISFIYTTARTCFIGEIFMLVLYLFYAAKCIKMKTISKYAAIFPLVITIVIIIFISSSFQFDLFNKILTGRPRLWFNHLGYFISEGNLLFGYDHTQTYAVALDCSYLTLFIDNGIIGDGLYCLFLFIGIKRCNSLYPYYIPIICGLLLSAVMENILLPLSPINLLLITLMYKCVYHKSLLKEQNITAVS